MAIPDGKPATDFSAMNREWVRAVAAEAAEAGGSGIPAPENPSDGDVLTYDSATSSWIAEAPSGGGGGFYVINQNTTTKVLDKTFIDIYNAFTSGYICVIKEYYDADEEYGAYWNFYVITVVNRNTDLQGEGDGGAFGDSGGTYYDALTDNAYPSLRT